MNIEADLIRMVKIYCHLAGIAKTTLGDRALKDSRAVSRLSNGTLTLRSANKLWQYMEQNWPGVIR